MKYLKKPTHMSLPKVIILDVLLLAVILLSFAFFHHVLPAMISEYERQQALHNTLPSEPPVSEPTVPATGDPTDPESTEQTEPPTEDPRTEWQIKFADYFTDEVVVTDHSYSSPEISITLETITVGEGRSQITYHVADIYVASLDNFTTVTANGEMRYFGTQDAQEMVDNANAILAISGDFLTYQKAGFLMRNGEIYQESTNNVSICVLFADGTMETYDKKEYNIQDIKSRGAVQVWSFGPVLLDENGKVCANYDVSQAVSYPNPRSAIGYYEPGHYCFVVVDGRQEGYSAGMTIPALAEVFQNLGCTSAYNLDGGGSAVMFFGGERYSRQSNGGDRALGDMLIIRASANTEQEAAE